MSRTNEPFPLFPPSKISKLAQLGCPSVLSAAHAWNAELLAQMLVPLLTMPPPVSVHEVKSWRMVRDRLSKKSLSSYEPGDRQAEQPLTDVYQPSGLGMHTQSRTSLAGQWSFWQVSMRW